MSDRPIFIGPRRVRGEFWLVTPFIGARFGGARMKRGYPGIKPGKSFRFANYVSDTHGATNEDVPRQLLPQIQILLSVFSNLWFVFKTAKIDGRNATAEVFQATSVYKALLIGTAQTFVRQNLPLISSIFSFPFINHLLLNSEDPDLLDLFTSNSIKARQFEILLEIFLDDLPIAVQAAISAAEHSHGSAEKSSKQTTESLLEYSSHSQKDSQVPLTPAPPAPPPPSPPPSRRTSSRPRPRSNASSTNKNLRKIKSRAKSKRSMTKRR